MNSYIIPNSSPIITMAKSGYLFLLLDYEERLKITQDVFDEIINGENTEEIKQHKIRLQKYIYKDYIVSPEIHSWGLGKGESSVIASSLKFPNSTIVIDDKQARKCAQIKGLKMIGTLGIIMAAKKEGKITSAKNAVKELILSGLFLDQNLVKTILKEYVNEDWEII